MDDLIQHPERLLAIIRAQTDIAKAIPNIAKVMELVAQHAQKLTSGSGGVIELVELSEMVYSAVSGSAAPFLGLRIKRTGSLSGLCIELRTPLYSEDTEADPRVSKEACRAIGARSMIVVPLRHGLETVGVLKVVSPEAKAFKTYDVETLELISGLIAATMSHSTDYQARAVESRELFIRATRDDLTGLANRALFYDRFRYLVATAKRSSKRVGVVSIDMDGLKQINDHHGHHAGDAALKELAGRIRRGTRETDTAARLGGDEFAIILSNVNDRESAKQSCKRLEAAIDAPFNFEGIKLDLRASYGVALFPDDGDDVNKLLQAADQAMYESKRQRKGAAPR